MDSPSRYRTRTTSSTSQCRAAAGSDGVRTKGARRIRPIALLLLSVLLILVTAVAKAVPDVASVQDPLNTVPAAGEGATSVTYGLSIFVSESDPVDDRYGISIGVRVNGSWVPPGSGGAISASGACTEVDTQFPNYFLCPDHFPGDSTGSQYTLSLPSGVSNVTLVVPYRQLPQEGPPRPDGTIRESFVTYVGNAPPVLSLTPDRNNYPVQVGDTLWIDLTATDPDNDDTLTFAVSNAPTGSDLLDYENGVDFIWTPADGQEGSYPNVLFTVTDDGDPVFSDNREIGIDVAALPPPTLEPIGDHYIRQLEPLAINLSASDPNEFNLTFAVSNAPTGSELADNGNGTALFSWTPTRDQEGIYDRVLFTVTNDAVSPRSDQEEINITVAEPVNHPPRLNPIGARVVDEGDRLDIVLTASDIDGDELTFSVSGDPDGSVFEGNGSGSARFTWTPDFGQAGSYLVTFDVTDNGTTDGVPDPLIDSEEVEIAVGDVNRSPVLARIGARMGKEGEELRFVMSASDLDGDSLSFSAQDLPGNASVVETGAGTALFSWTPGPDTRGTHEVAFIVADDGTPPLTDTETVLIEIVPANRRPSLSIAGDTAVDEGELLRVVINATDLDGDALSLSAEGLPADAGFVDNGNGSAEVSWVPGPGTAGTYDWTFTVTDDGTPPQSTSETLRIEVRIPEPTANKPPELSMYGTPVINAGAMLRLQLTATDPDDDALSFSADRLPAGAAFVDNRNGTADFSWKPSAGAHGIYTVSFSVTDNGTPPRSDTLSVPLDVYRYGDVDRDGDVDREDVDRVLERLDRMPRQSGAADVDQDGDISVLDARLVVIKCTRKGCATQ